MQRQCLHLIGFPHTRFDEDRYPTCAYTTKCVRLVEMLASVGRETTVYWGGDEAVSHCADHVSVLSNEEQERFYGTDPNAPVMSISWDRNEAPWKMLNYRSIAALMARYQPGDTIMFLSGVNNEPIIDAIPEAMYVEPCVGYTGISQRAYRCFESYAWMHHLYGRYGIENGWPGDTVIPNYCRPADFVQSESKGYALYIGRLISRKGIEDAATIAAAAGLELVVAGDGAATVEDGRIVATDGTVMEHPNMRYVGIVGREERKHLMAEAAVTLVPTRYIGPFETVHAESLMSGVHVVTTDWGVFTETVDPAFRFRTVAQAVEAVDRAVEYRGRTLDGESLSDHAASRFSTDVCAKQYDEWLGRLQTL